MLVSRHDELVEYARAFRNYGKPDHEVDGLNFRMSEFTAAIGLVQTRAPGRDRAAKNEVARDAARPALSRLALELPDGMTSGLYKYIVFDPIERSTGEVYDEPCHRILGDPASAAEYRLGRREPLVRARSTTRPRARRAERLAASEAYVRGPGHRRVGIHRLARGRQADRRRPRAAHLRPAALAAPLAGRHRARRSGDLTDREALAVRAGGCDAIIHLGGGRRRGRRRRGPRPAPSGSTRSGTFEVLEVAPRRGDQARHLRQHDLGLQRREPDRSTRRRRCRRRATSTPRRSWPGSCTASPTRALRASSTRSCASASRTARGRGRRP